MLMRGARLEQPPQLPRLLRDVGLEGHPYSRQCFPVVLINLYYILNRYGKVKAPFQRRPRASYLGRLHR